MKKFVFILLAVVLLSSQDIFAQPKMEIVGGTKKDWGEVSPNQSPLKTQIKIKNIGNETLHISKVKPGCGCTTAPLDKDKVKPGEFAIVNVELNVANYSNNVHKSIDIATNDPEQANVKYHLYCKVMRPVQTLPKFVNITSAEVGKESKGTFEIRNNSDEKVTIKEIILQPEDMKISISKDFVLEPKGKYDIEVLITPKDLGRVRGNITLKTDNAEASFVRIPVYCSVIDSKDNRKNRPAKNDNSSKH